MTLAARSSRLSNLHLADPVAAENKSFDPVERARSIASSAATKAAVPAGTFALPPGPLRWLTILPELITIWKIQTQMVADIAGTYGKQTFLTREQMLYCLFRHTAVQAVRDWSCESATSSFAASRFVLFRQCPEGRCSHYQRVFGKSISRWLPIIGALGVGAYAYYDTGQVARTAIELFEGEIEIDPPEARNENG